MTKVHQHKHRGARVQYNDEDISPRDSASALGCRENKPSNATQRIKPKIQPSNLLPNAVRRNAPLSSTQRQEVVTAAAKICEQFATDGDIADAHHRFFDHPAARAFITCPNADAVIPTLDEVKDELARLNNFDADARQCKRSRVSDYDGSITAFRPYVL